MSRIQSPDQLARSTAEVQRQQQRAEEAYSFISKSGGLIWAPLSKEIIDRGNIDEQWDVINNPVACGQIWKRATQWLEWLKEKNARWLIVDGGLHNRTGPLRDVNGDHWTVRIYSYKGLYLISWHVYPPGTALLDTSRIFPPRVPHGSPGRLFDENGRDILPKQVPLSKGFETDFWMFQINPEVAANIVKQAGTPAALALAAQLWKDPGPRGYDDPLQREKKFDVNSLDDFPQLGAKRVRLEMGSPSPSPMRGRPRGRGDSIGGTPGSSRPRGRGRGDSIGGTPGSSRARGRGRGDSVRGRGWGRGRGDSVGGTPTPNRARGRGRGDSVAFRPRNEPKEMQTAFEQALRDSERRK